MSGIEEKISEKRFENDEQDGIANTSRDIDMKSPEADNELRSVKCKSVSKHDKLEDIPEHLEPFSSNSNNIDNSANPMDSVPTIEDPQREILSGNPIDTKETVQTKCWIYCIVFCSSFQIIKTLLIEL